MVTTPWSENFPLQSIKFPRGGSSWVENGLNKLSWETWVYELGPLRGQTHSFHSSGWGEILSPLFGTEGLYWQGAPEEAHREGILNLGTILCPATMGQWEVVEPGPGKLSPGLLGAERSGEKHTDETSATSALSHPVREELDVWGRTRVDSETSLETQTDPLVPGWTPSISAPPPRGGASIPRASAPVSTRCLLLYCGSPGCKLLEETTTSLGTTGGSGHTSLQSGRDRKPPWWFMWETTDVLSECTSTWWPLRSARNFLRAKNTANISRRLMCHEKCWSFHRPWLERPSKIAPPAVREASVISILRWHEAPSTGPWDRNHGSSTLPRHESIAAWPWSCERGCLSGKTLWSWATTVEVSCTAHILKPSCCLLAIMLVIILTDNTK